MLEITKPLSIFIPANGPGDDGAVEQMANCLAPDAGVAGTLSADHHLGYSMPIGGTIAYKDAISPSGVGYDIGCGNMAVATSLFYGDIRTDLPRIMDEIASRISFGMGQPAQELTDHPVIDKIRAEGPTRQIKDLQSLAYNQLGTVGSGNHYVDLFREEKTDRVWIGVHFGSRGFGHKIASGFLALAQGKRFDEHADGGEMHSPPVLLDTRAPLGYTYLEAMKLAGEYAYAGRETVVAKVLDILGNPAVTHTVHNHHNFGWEEEHLGEKVWVVRKGATPLFPNQQGFVGGSMGENAVIIEGTIDKHPDGFATGERALWSAPHGAGRAMSRTEAKGKQRKRWHDPATGWTQQPNTPAPSDEEIAEKGLKKIWVTERAGKVDWPAVRSELGSRGVHLRGGDADEAPQAYKRLPDVLAAHAAYVEIKHQLRPIGVAMAGAGVKDAYKD
jgi:tRNA-splicing ligase RtcB